MAKLQFSLDGNSMGEYELDKERITIGRRPSNDIHIDNLAVSGDHAVITTIGTDSFLEDMNSTNGTLVNNKSIKKHVLQHQDMIEFGKYQLLYINAAQAKTPANQSGFENTVVMRPAKLNVASVETNKSADSSAEIEQPASPPTNDDTAETPAENIEADSSVVAKAPPAPAATQTSTPANNATKVGRLQMLNGANSGREITLNKALTTLGKAGTQVAVITKRPHGYYITHVEGENLPFINGQKIGLQAHALNDHDVIDMAGLKMEFFLS